MYQHILVPLDGSNLAEQVLPHVKESARPDSQVTLLRVIPDEYIQAIVSAGRYTANFSAEEQIARTQAEEQAYLEQVAADLRTEGLQVQVVVQRGDPADAIIDFVDQHGVDLIIIASHGRSGINRWIFGSITQKVLHRADLPVLVVRPRARQ